MEPPVWKFGFSPDPGLRQDDGRGQVIKRPRIPLSLTLFPYSVFLGSTLNPAPVEPSLPQPARRMPDAGHYRHPSIIQGKANAKSCVIYVQT
jgi:hypothetical protein